MLFLPLFSPSPASSSSSSHLSLFLFSSTGPFPTTAHAFLPPLFRPNSLNPFIFSSSRPNIFNCSSSPLNVKIARSAFRLPNALLLKLIDDTTSWSTNNFSLFLNSSMIFETNFSTTFSHSFSVSHFNSWSVFNAPFALASSLSMWSTYPLISVEFSRLGFESIFHFPVFSFRVFISSCRIVFTSLAYILLRSYSSTFFSTCEKLFRETSASTSSPNTSANDGNWFLAIDAKAFVVSPFFLLLALFRLDSRLSTSLSLSRRC
mmetsp:Transcript_1932/g.5881  ORF Transcript_1932/g.5881 Transcript_1932/m.5881 type:complete len:262 (+) Transcript_1932:1337-2122(+)